MSLTATATKKATCECCGNLVDGVCLNVNCIKAQETATATATRTTAKVAVPGAKVGSRTVRRPDPRSFNISGRVD